MTRKDFIHEFLVRRWATNPADVRIAMTPERFESFKVAVRTLADQAHDIEPFDDEPQARTTLTDLQRLIYGVRRRCNDAGVDLAGEDP